MALPETHPSVPELFELARKKLELPSHYALAKYLGVNPSRIANYRHGRATPDDEMCLRIAKILDYPGPYVLALIQMERTHQPEARRLLRENVGEIYAMCKTYGERAIVIFVCLAAISAALPDPGGLVDIGESAVLSNHYTKWALFVAGALALWAAAARWRRSSGQDTPEAA